MIDCGTVNSWLEDEEAILIDVREPHEYAQAHINGSIHIPLGECSAERIPHDPSKKLVFHCKSGMRSDNACKGCIETMPETTIYNLEGGIDKWIELGFPYVS